MVSKLVIEAPLSLDDKKYLGLYAMAHLLGTSCALIQKAAPNLSDKPISAIAEEFMSLLILVMQQQEAKEQH